MQRGCPLCLGLPLQTSGLLPRFRPCLQGRSRAAAYPEAAEVLLEFASEPACDPHGKLGQATGCLSIAGFQHLHRSAVSVALASSCHQGGGGLSKLSHNNLDASKFCWCRQIHLQCQGPPALCEVSKELPEEVHAEYMKNAAYLEDADAHAVYPTSIYRQ